MYCKQMPDNAECKEKSSHGTGPFTCSPLISASVEVNDIWLFVPK